jgi:hypothetical protein
MVIRQQQMAAFARAMQNRFEQQMLVHLHANFQNHIGDLSDEQVLRLIRDGIDESATHGIRAEGDVARYIEFLVIYGPGFQSLGWAAEILATPSLDGAGKMDQIDNYDLFNR